MFSDYQSNNNATVNSGGIASASMRDTDTNLSLNREYIAPGGNTFSGAQKGGAPIKCKGKKRPKCSTKTCIWTSKGYCRKKGKMTCRGKNSEDCGRVKIHIPTISPPVVGRCKYSRGNVRSSCRRIRHYTRRPKSTRRRRGTRRVLGLF